MELFAGAGGLALGLERAGFDPIALIEIDRDAAETLKLNLPHRNVICNDIANLSPLNLKTHFDLEVGELDLLSGGAPCQAFSYAGKRLGLEDARGTLFFRIAEIVRDRISKGKKPAAIILENVRSLKTHDKGRTFATIKRILEVDLAYKVFDDILNSADYGVPQTRNRTYIVCFADPSAKYLPPPALPLEKKMKDLLEDTVDQKYFLSAKILPTILSNGTGGYKAKSEIDLDIARPLCATMAKMHRACQDNYVTQSGRVRRLTPRECARLQGFDDSFVIPVSDAQAYKQFGNAVTVNVAYHVAMSVKDTLKELGEWNER